MNKNRPSITIVLRGGPLDGQFAYIQPSTWGYTQGPTRENEHTYLRTTETDSEGRPAFDYLHLASDDRTGMLAICRARQLAGWLPADFDCVSAVEAYLKETANEEATDEA